MKDVHSFAVETREWRRHIESWINEQRDMHRENVALQREQRDRLESIKRDNRRFGRHIVLAVIGAVVTGVVAIVVDVVNHALTLHVLTTVGK